MDAHFKSQLPDLAVSLVDRIEKFAGREILIAVDTRPVPTTDPNPDRLAVEVTENSATIYIRSKDSFPPHAVVHELLHIERFWNEGIPQGLPLQGGAGGERWQITSSIENALEHLVIVPREENYGFEPYGYWNETTRRNWHSYPWPDMTDPWARRKNCLLGWLTVANLITDPEVKAHVESCLAREGLLGEARQFAAKIAKTIHCKPLAIKVVLKFLKIPVQDVQLVQMDVARRKRNRFPIPAH